MSYNTEPVSLDRALSIAKVYLKIGIVPLLVGPPGCGKTTLAQMLANHLHAELYPVRLNNVPPEESVGLQYIDEAAQRTIRYAPKWAPASDGSDGPRLVFLDEYGQASDEYRKGIMSALLEGYIGNHKLPDNCYFLAASNSSDDGSNVYELDSATAQRFGIIRVRADFEVWSRDYAEGADIDLSIMAFLRMRPDYFDTCDMAEGEVAQPEDEVIRTSARKWTQASDFLREAATTDDPDFTTDDARMGIMGLLGSTVTESFWLTHGQIMNAKSLDEILEMDRQGQLDNSPKTHDVLWAYGQAMIWSAKSASRIADIMQLFDVWKMPDDIPYVETRTHIVETMLGRARVKHGVKTSDDPRIAQRLKAWRNLAEVDETKEEIIKASEQTNTLRLAA